MAKSKQAKKANQPAKSGSKTGGATQKQVKKERGTLLTVLLVLIMLHGIFGAYLAYITRKEAYANSTTWVLPALALVSLATVIGAAGMFLWKKWGIYLYAAACVVAAVVHVVLTGLGLAFFYDLLPVIFLGYVINKQSKQHLFT